jgi:uncharacterized cupin superfamily protein
MTDLLMLHRAGDAPLNTAFRPGGFGPSDPLGPHRELVGDDLPSVAAGRVRFQGDLRVAEFPHIETLVVVEGRLTIEAADAPSLVLGIGEGAVIGRGTDVRIRADAPATFVFYASTGSETGPGGVAALKAEADFKPSTSTLPPEVLIGPAPRCRSDNVFTDEARGYMAGAWDSTPYHRIVREHRLHEFMYIVDGSVRFEKPDGSSETVDAGDAVFVPQGAPIGWESRGRVAKFYVVQPA